MSVLAKNYSVEVLEERKQDWRIWFICFLVFCFIGWFFEGLVFKFELGYGFVNRRFLFGPWLPVYGFGGMAIILSLSNLKAKRIVIGNTSITPVLCFFSIVFLCTAVELVTSYIMELVTGSWLWDYTEDIPNFQGRIALKSSIRFGIIGMAGLYGIYPAMKSMLIALKNIKPKIFGAMSYLLIGLFLVDVAARFFVGGNYVGPR